MKPVLLKSLAFVIELPLILCVVIGFLLLVLLHFINIETAFDDPEECDVKRHPKPNDKFWLY